MVVIILVVLSMMVMMMEVLEAHLREHLGVEDMTKEERLEEVISILKSYLK
jgi:DNA-binding FrmR family transcriptional regulator